MAYSDEPWIDVVRAEGFYYILIGIIVAFSAVLIDFLIDRQKRENMRNHLFKIIVKSLKKKKKVV